MKNSIKNCFCFSLSLILLTLMLSFNIGEQVELEGFINARSSARFFKSSKNRKAILIKGTHGEIIEIKKMLSGNYGIKIKVKTGPHYDESFWVYYNLKLPLIKLMDENDHEKKSEEINLTKKAELTADQIAYRAEEEKAMIDATAILNSLNKKGGSEIVENPKSSDCAPFVSLPEVTQEEIVKSEIDTCIAYVLNAEKDQESNALLDQMIKDLNSDKAVKKKLTKKNFCKILTEVQFSPVFQDIG